MKFADSKKFYDKKYFDEENTHEKKDSIKNYRRIFRNYKIKAKTVLDLGCGRGMFVKHCREKGMEAYGVDFSDYAGTLIPEWFIKQDIRKELPFPNKKFDVVICSAVFEHLPEEDIDKVYKEMQRVGKNLFAVIGYRSKISNGIETHLTIKDWNWWIKKIPNIKILNPQ